MNMLWRYIAALIIIFALPIMISAQSPSILGLGITSNSKNGKIVVRFSNQGQRSIRIWKGANSWAWDNVRIILLRNHTSFYFRHNPTEGFTRNGPAYEEVQVNKGANHMVDIFDGSWVASANASKKIVKGDIIICAYTVDSTPDSAKYDVWVGMACAMTEVE